MGIEQNGYLPVAGVTITLPSSARDYEMLGTVEEQAKINDLKSFVPGMVGRKLLPVRNQGACGSCYSFAVAHSLSSAYNQANELGSNPIELSNQHIMNCMPLQPVFLNVSGAFEANPEWIYQDKWTGCWAGNPGMVINFFVDAGLESLPLRDTEPYIGVSSHCNLEQDTVATVLTGYSPILSIEEMKNALYFRGDVAIMYDATASQDFTWPEDKTYIKWPSDDIALDGTANLGVGNSYALQGINHVVAVVGWGPCEVKNCKTNVTEDTECWILQNSWGPSSGTQGFNFIHTDLDCDAGIISSGEAMIPLIDVLATEKNRGRKRCGSFDLSLLCYDDPVSFGTNLSLEWYEA